MPAAALLLHRLPDGSTHYDWLLQRDDPPDAPLITFRTLTRPDADPPPSSITAQRLPDHRARYLTYEGPVSGNRGSVQRLATGTCRIHSETPDHLEFTAEFPPSPPQRWTAAPDGSDGTWRLALARSA